MEEKRIPGFEEYTVTPEGRVFSYKFGRKRELRIYVYDGRNIVKLSKNSYPYYRSVPLLVASAFLPKPNKKCYMIKHINGNKLDDNLSNLRWVVSRDNI